MTPKRTGSNALWLAWARVAFLPLLWLEEWLADRPGLNWEGVEVVLGIAGLYAVVALALARRSPDRPPGGWYLTVTLDLVLLTTLTIASGGAESPLRYAFAVVPIGAAFIGRPRDTALATLASVVAYLVAALLGPPPQPEPIRTVAVLLATVAWQGVLALLLSILLTRRSDEIADLAESRRRLLARVQRAEDRARESLAHELHDGPVQSLLAVRLELGRARRGKLEALDAAEEGIASTVAELRTAIFDLYPHSLNRAGLAAALRDVADQQSRAGGLPIDVAIDPAATGHHDEVLYLVGRELLFNAVRHANATRCELLLQRLDGRVVLTVEDDGRGFDGAARESALRAGHVGLSACATRIDAAGGSMSVESGPDAGTRVVVDLPLQQAERRVAPGDLLSGVD